MRRKLSHTPYARMKAAVYACSILALAVYGLPRIPKLAPGMSGTFSMLWILFAFLAVAANVYYLVGADKERSRLVLAAEAGKTRARGSEETAVQGSGVRRLYGRR